MVGVKEVTDATASGTTSILRYKCWRFRLFELGQWYSTLTILAAEQTLVRNNFSDEVSLTCVFNLLQWLVYQRLVLVYYLTIV